MQTPRFECLTFLPFSLLYNGFVALEVDIMYMNFLKGTVEEISDNRVQVFSSALASGKDFPRVEPKPSRRKSQHYLSSKTPFADGTSWLGARLRQRHRSPLTLTQLL